MSEAAPAPIAPGLIYDEGHGAYKIPALRVLTEITSSLSSEDNLDSLLERFLGTMIKLAGADAGAVRVLAADGEHLRLVGAIGLPPEVVECERYIPLECGVCGSAVREHAVQHGDSHQLRFCSERTSLTYFGERCHRIIAVPLRYQGKILGVYNLFMAGDEAVPEDVALLFHSISEHLGMALENARLTRENLRITLTNERQMLANELHDSLAQTLSFMNMRLSLLRDAMENRDQDKSDKYLNDLGRALDSAYAELRELLAQFRNRMDPRGLLPALWDIVSAFQDRNGINLDLDNRVPDMNLPPDQEVQVYHIVHEALTNASKHSRAQNAKITIDLQNDQYLFTVEDDGVGIIQPLKSGDGMHLGLNIMRERAQRLGGNVSVENRKEGGVCVTLTFPAGNARKEAK